MAVTNYMVVRLGRVNINASGNVASAGDPPPITPDVRVIPRDAVPNSAGYPTIEAYLEAELSLGRRLLHSSDTVIVTGEDIYSDAAIAPDVKAFTVALTSEPIVALPTFCRGVLLQAHPDNAGRIWVGIGSAAVDKGLYLDAGSAMLPMPVSDLSLICALATQVGDKLLYQPRG